jgi:predicted PilT family ATPase
VTLTTYCSEDLEKQLASLVKHAAEGSAQLHDLTKQIIRLQNDTTVASLSQNAQIQVRGLLELSTTAQDRIINNHIRKSLAFPKMHERSQDITKADNDTYGWLFESGDSPHMSTAKLDARERYSEWLISGSGIFHVAGKPGSGKSTLMKYLYRHTGTKGKLCKWAGKLYFGTSLFSCC